MADPDSVEWLPFPDVAEQLGITVSQVRRLVEDRALLAVRREGIRVIPAAFLSGAETLRDLKGTIVVLGDAGFSDDEALYWLLSPDDSLGVAPVDALRAGRRAEVRRIAASLAF